MTWCQLYPLLPPLGSDWPNFPLTFLHKQHILSPQLLSLPPQDILSVTALSVTTWISSANTEVSPLSQLQFQLFYIMCPSVFGMGMAKWTTEHHRLSGRVMVCPTYFNIRLNHIHSCWRSRRYVPLNTTTNLYNTLLKPQPQNTTILRKLSLSVPSVSYLHWLFSILCSFLSLPQ